MTHRGADADPSASATDAAPAEMSHFGEETFYGYGQYAHPDPLAATRASHYWYFWWD